jgi:hypothetical protein
MLRNIEEMARKASYNNCLACLFQQQERKKSCRRSAECSIKIRQDTENAKDDIGLFFQSEFKKPLCVLGALPASACPDVVYRERFWFGGGSVPL